MSVLIKHMAMPKGCIYANDKDQTEYCPLLNHDDVPFCQYIENEPEIAIGIGERPVYCPLSDVPEPCENTVSRQAAIDALGDEPEVWTGKDEYAQGLNNQWHYDRNAIKALPSAQPEIVRCGQCKHYYFADNRIPQEQRYTCELDGDRWKADDFCSYAEREE